jgi:peptidoglycan/xylan/chitin deacetylase (PgdA/CDA1 family)
MKDSGKPFLLRVDDFPAWEESMDQFVPATEFESFHAILASHGIPYMIGVTPQPALSPLDLDDHRTRQLTDEECSIVQHITKEGASIGLHGVTHRTRRDRPHSEFIDLDNEFFEEMILYADLELQRLTGIRAEVFVPPFNRITLGQMHLLGRRFRIVCGGPETTAIIGRLGIHPISNISTYVPSYPPLYGRAHEIASSLQEHPVDSPTCLTLHWEWERRRGYAELEQFCKIIQGRVNHWSEWRDATAS